MSSTNQTVVFYLLEKQYMNWNVYKTSNSKVTVSMTDANNSNKVYFNAVNNDAAKGKMVLMASGTAWSTGGPLKIRIESDKEFVKTNNTFMVTSQSEGDDNGVVKGFGEVVVADDGSLTDTYMFNDIYIMIATWNTAG
jgi:hypothetical protein